MADIETLWLLTNFGFACHFVMNILLDKIYAKIFLMLRLDFTLLLEFKLINEVASYTKTRKTWNISFIQFSTSRTM